MPNVFNVGNVVKQLIWTRMKAIEATQVVSCAPWEISPQAIQSEEVLREVARVKRGPRTKPVVVETEPSMFADL